MSRNCRKAVPLVSAAVLAAVAGCSDRIPNPGPESKPNLSVEEQGPVDSYWTFDDERDRIAREEVPGFGGLIYDEDQNPVVYLVDIEQRPARTTVFVPLREYLNRTMWAQRFRDRPG